MKYKIAKILLLFVVLAELTSCYTNVKTDRKYYGHYHYRRAGNYW